MLGEIIGRLEEPTRPSPESLGGSPRGATAEPASVGPARDRPGQWWEALPRLSDWQNRLVVRRILRRLFGKSAVFPQNSGGCSHLSGGCFSSSVRAPPVEFLCDISRA